MGKMFIVTFDFWGIAHQAAVTMYAEETGTAAFTVCILDEDLGRILPGGRFSYISFGDPVPSGIQTHPAEELILSVKVAISKHLLLPTAGK